MESHYKSLVILDPGLRELGGHHPATMLAIADALLETSNINIELLCHKECPVEFTGKLNCKVKVTRHFTTGFYRYFYKTPSNIELQKYCNYLALEYIRAIKLSLELNVYNNKVVFWCHTLNWQHAKALALALDVLNKQLLLEDYSKIKLLIGLMYSPKDSANTVKRKMHYELAFRHLAKHNNVTFLAVDYELQRSYSKLLNKNIDIQPCLLFGNKKLNKNKISKNNAIESVNATGNAIKKNNKSIILYTGDAKINKGFLELPKIAEALLSKLGDYKFVIQYSITNDSIELSDTDSRLSALAEKYSNLILKNKFIEHHDLMNLFEVSDAIFFNYDADIYQHQSSGVLWLAAYHHLSIINYTENWISRESARLNLSQLQCKSVDGVQNAIFNVKPKQTHLESEHTAKSVSHFSNDYRQQLFANVLSWIERVI
ncbi:hypothetical protein [Pseudoalteromonas sp. NCIMB_1079]|uniref:hypothetical protein n=1 Tax=Pseudoalteromonas sp. NCIMB 1079 TaxID=3142847 RepID=UPI00339C89A7